MTMPITLGDAAEVLGPVMQAVLRCAVLRCAAPRWQLCSHYCQLPSKWDHVGGGGGGG